MLSPTFQTTIKDSAFSYNFCRSGREGEGGSEGRSGSWGGSGGGYSASDATLQLYQHSALFSSFCRFSFDHSSPVHPHEDTVDWHW